MNRLFGIVSILPVLILLSCGEPSDRDISGKPNILLIIIDTLRADHLGYWGYSRDISPVLDSLAESGTAWMETQAQSSWTLPATASILTGLTPREHGAGKTEGITYGLAGSLRSLQGTLHTAGWKTGGLFNVIFLSEDFGFHRGFDYFNCQGVVGNTGCRRADETVDDALFWLSTLDTDTKFLLVVHFYDPHIPYDPPAPYNTMYTNENYTGNCDNGWGSVPQLNALNSGDSIISTDGLGNLIALYDGEIMFTDREIGRLLGELRSSGKTDSTLVIVIADHGEEFLDHSGIEHGRTLYQEVLHVPFIMSGPGIPEGNRVFTPATQIDLLPTLLSYLEFDIPKELSGRDLLSEQYPDLDIPASNLLWSEIQQASIRRDSMKIIWNADGSHVELFDLASDPSELHSLPVIDDSMIESVEFYWSTPPVCNPPEVSFGESMTRRLRDLGYIR